VSLHVADRRRRHQAMLYVMRVVALPIVCQTKKLRSLAVSLVLCAVACARTGLYPGDLAEGEPSDESEGASAGTATSSAGRGAGGVSTGGASAGGGQGGQGAQSPGGAPPATNGRTPSPPIGNPPQCTPTNETCNGRDDDCNGAVDDLPAEACAGGGFRFCVAGRLSQCPKRCEVCVPGSVRVCQNSFCSFWGEQECAADGQGFGICREAEPPTECAAIAKQEQKSRELEQCCLDNGYCCLDEFDLDRDGNRREMLGACQDIACQ
jgi:hypothetical protein